MARFATAAHRGGGTNMVAIVSGGINFKHPQRLRPYIPPVADLLIGEADGTPTNSTTTAFFTELARRGLQDTTNWTNGVYKTLLNVASGRGEVAALVGPTAGGAETTTFRITVDGVVHVLTSETLASGERAAFLAAYFDSGDYSTAGSVVNPGDEALEASKATWTTLSNLNSETSCIPPWRAMRGIPMLEFTTSLLIEAKHSADITNSTATAYSGVMYRLFLSTGV